MAMNKFVYGATPVLRRSRSKFDLSYQNKTSVTAGRLQPCYIQEIYPGDTFKNETNIVARVSSSFLKPVMDNCFLDVYYFFVPHRLTYNRWEEVMGENKKNAWAQTEEVEVPVLKSGNVSTKSVGDFFGLPISHVPAGISVLPFRAFALIYDQWFRDENIIQPMNVQKGVLTSEAFNSDVWTSKNYMGQCPKVSKMHDYFTSVLPSPQKGTAGGVQSTTTGATLSLPVYDTVVSSDIPDETNIDLAALTGDFSSNMAMLRGRSPSTGAILGSVYLAPSGGDTNVDLPSLTSTWDINEFRYANAVQKMLEKDARGGTRYSEILQSHFGVYSPDSRLQRTEFIGGRRIPLNIQGVTQTSASTAESPQANMSATSLTNGRTRWTKSFVEHGYVIGVCCLRQFHTYEQGIERFWSRKKRFDFYDPAFANIGEQPIYTSEIFSKNVEILRDLNVALGKDSVFGYAEAWTDLRTRPSKISGDLRPSADKGFGIWTFADEYTTAPTLSRQFIEETPKYIDRALSVDSTKADQFLVDFYFKQEAIRPLPTYSVPKL